MLGSLEFTDFAASSTKIIPKTHEYSRSFFAPTGAGGFAEVLLAVTWIFLCQVKMHSCMWRGLQTAEATLPGSFHFLFAWNLLF